MKTHRALVILSSASALALLGAGCSSSSVQTDSKPVAEQPVQQPAPMAAGGAPTGKMQPQPAPEVTEAQKAQLAAGEAAHQPTTLTFDMASGMFYYVPNQIKVKKGDTVKVVVKNMGGHHDFNIDELNVHMKANDGGTTETVQFVADKAGSFEYYCSIGRHRQMGQKGTLIVE